MENMTLEKLAVDHDYYSSDSNFFSNEAKGTWVCFSEFYNNFINADVDLNLIFRWDIRKHDDSDGYYCEIFMIHQRKGIYNPHFIENIYAEDVPKFIELVTKHWEKLISIWNPISQKPVE